MFTANIITEQEAYSIKLLSGDDEAAVQDLCERCSDFTELVEGRPPEPDAGRSILFDCPPDKDLTDKFDYGVYNESNTLIAIIDLIKDYKAVGDWIIGLLMIDPSHRGHGLGRKLHYLISTWVYEEQGKKLRIGVVAENHSGYEFWRAMGYTEVDRVTQQLGAKEQVVISMEFLIDGKGGPRC